MKNSIFVKAVRLVTAFAMTTMVGGVYAASALADVVQLSTQGIVADYIYNLYGQNGQAEYAMSRTDGVVSLVDVKGNVLIEGNSSKSVEAILDATRAVKGAVVGDKSSLTYQITDVHGNDLLNGRTFEGVSNGAGLAAAFYSNGNEHYVDIFDVNDLTKVKRTYDICSLDSDGAQVSCFSYVSKNTTSGNIDVVAYFAWKDSSTQENISRIFTLDLDSGMVTEGESGMDDEDSATSYELYDGSQCYLNANGTAVCITKEGKESVLYKVSGDDYIDGFVCYGKDVISFVSSENYDRIYGFVTETGDFKVIDFDDSSCSDFYGVFSYIDDDKAFIVHNGKRVQLEADNPCSVEVTGELTCIYNDEDGSHFYDVSGSKLANTALENARYAAGFTNGYIVVSQGGYNEEAETYDFTVTAYSPTFEKLDSLSCSNSEGCYTMEADKEVACLSNNGDPTLLVTISNSKLVTKSLDAMDVAGLKYLADSQVYELTYWSDEIQGSICIDDNLEAANVPGGYKDSEGGDCLYNNYELRANADGSISLLDEYSQIVEKTFVEAQPGYHLSCISIDDGSMFTVIYYDDEFKPFVKKYLYAGGGLVDISDAVIAKRDYSTEGIFYILNGNLMKCSEGVVSEVCALGRDGVESLSVSYNIADVSFSEDDDFEICVDLIACKKISYSDFGLPSTLYRCENGYFAVSKNWDEEDDLDCTYDVTAYNASGSKVGTFKKERISYYSRITFEGNALFFFDEDNELVSICALNSAGALKTNADTFADCSLDYLEDSKLYKIFNGEDETSTYLDENLDKVAAPKGSEESYEETMINGHYAWQAGTLKNGTVIYRYGEERSDGTYVAHICDINGNPIVLNGYKLGVDGAAQLGEKNIFFAKNSAGKVGAVNSSGQVVVPFDYIDLDYASDSYNTVVLRKSDGKLYFYNVDETVVGNAPGGYNADGSITPNSPVAAVASPVKQTITAKPASKTFKAKKLKKKAATFKINAKAKTALTYKSSAKKIKVAKNGKVTVKKGIKKGTYKITITAAATSAYKKATKVIVIKVK